MEKAPTVLLLGESLLTESIAYGLADRMFMKVVRLDPAMMELRDCVQCVEPDLILFNLEDTGVDRLVSLLSEREEERQTDMDMSRYHLIILAGHRFVPQTIHEILSAVNSRKQNQAVATG